LFRSEIFEQHAFPEVQAGVRARGQRVVDADGVRLTAADRQRAGRRQVVRGIRIAADDQKERAGGILVLALSRDHRGSTAHVRQYVDELPA
jgi:hypothetical protein